MRHNHLLQALLVVAIVWLALMLKAILVTFFIAFVITLAIRPAVVRLHPIIIILSLLIGAELYGILGALLSVPVALVISCFVDSFRNESLSSATVKTLALRKR